MGAGRRGAPASVPAWRAAVDGPSWAGSRASYVSNMGSFGAHFRVIAPALRGHGKTVNPGGGPISYTQAADDLLALIAAS
jgi:pimeloyl-ACP methyl ester carboxylesterase